MVGAWLVILAGVGGPQPEGEPAYPAEVHGYVHADDLAYTYIYDAYGQELGHSGANGFFSTCNWPNAKMTLTHRNAPWCICAEIIVASGPVKYTLYDAELIPFSEFNQTVVCPGEQFARKAAEVNLYPSHAGASCGDYNSIVECRQ